MYYKRVPQGIQQVLSSATWSLPGSGKVYFTFDDGPSSYTPALLELLQTHDAQASFFLLGEQVEAHPDIYSKLCNSAHTVGHHSYSHPDGWRTATEAYLSDVSQGAALIDSRLYRPPYGRMRPAQWQTLKKHYDIVMYDIMPGDFDPKTSIEQAIETVENHLADGSIIVLHDNEKVGERMLAMLPEMLDIAEKKGLICAPLPSQMSS